MAEQKPASGRPGLTFGGLLLDETKQNDRLPASIRSLIVDGIDADEIPGVFGDFGRSPTNPIPVNGPSGEITYLSLLRTRSGTPLLFHRIGSTEGLVGMVDMFELRPLDGSQDTSIFMSMYHPRRSRKAPEGFTLATELDPSNIHYGVTHLVEDFPARLDMHIREMQMAFIGLPLPVRRVRKLLYGIYL